MGFLNQNKPVL